MKKVFIVGAGPLPNEKEGIREAAGLRTEQFFRPLEKKGHQIVLVCITNNEPKIPEEKTGNTKIFRISRHNKNLQTFISRQLRQFSPDAALGINTFPAFVLAKIIPKDIPFWADLNGWIMAEAQARSWSEDNNTIFANAWRQQKKILLKADKISTVSTAQKFCTIGEMANLGLLRKENFLQENIFAIPNSTKFFDIDNPVETRSARNDNSLFRGKTVPENAFVISWIGGYNNWVDEKTLFNALESAMDTVDNLYFVSTGGKIKNIAGTTFSRFLERIKASRHQSRFVFLGWIETEDMRKIYAESDAGINVDFSCIETWTGARNRINEMLKFGLPVLTTGGSEIGEDIKKYNAGITVKNGDMTAIKNAIVDMANASKGTLDEYKKNAEYMATEVFEETMLTKPVQEFIDNPQKNALPVLSIQSPLFFMKNIFWYLQKNGMKIFLAKIWQRI